MKKKKLNESKVGAAMGSRSKWPTVEPGFPGEEPTGLSRLDKEGKMKEKMKKKENKKKTAEMQTPVENHTGRFHHTRSLNQPSNPRTLDARVRRRHPLGTIASQHFIPARP